MTAKAIVTAAMALLATTALAQEQGDPEQGRLYAARVCAECHVTGRQGGAMDPSGARSFKEISNRPDTTAISLAAWLQSEHVNMPHIMLAPHDLNDVIAYIVSLKK